MIADLLSGYDRALRVVDRVVSWVVIAAMAMLLVVVSVQVFFRYVLNDSLVWGWDVPRLCFIVAILMSIPLGLRYNAHVGIDLVVERLPAAVQRGVLRLNAALMFALFAIAAYYGVALLMQTADQMMPGIQLSVGWFYVSLIVSQLHCCLHIVRILVLGRTTGEALGDA